MIDNHIRPLQPTDVIQNLQFSEKSLCCYFSKTKHHKIELNECLATQKGCGCVLTSWHLNTQFRKRFSNYSVHVKMWFQSWDAQQEMHPYILLHWEHSLSSAVILRQWFPSTDCTQGSHFRMNHRISLPSFFWQVSPCCNCPRKMWVVDGCKMWSIWSDYVLCFAFIHSLHTLFLIIRHQKNDFWMTLSMCSYRHADAKKHSIHCILWMPILLFRIHHVSRHFLIHLSQPNSLFVLKLCIKCLLLG